jgi:hypothetical protein
MHSMQCREVKLLVLAYLKAGTGSMLSSALWEERAENPKQIFPEMKLRGFVPNSCIYVSVSDLYFPTIGPSVRLFCFIAFADRLCEYINR